MLPVIPTNGARAMNNRPNHSEIALISRAQRMLAEARSIDDVLHVENLAQRARDFAKEAGLGRDAVNACARHALDARRMAGAMLKEMKDRGELAERGRKAKKRRPATTNSEMSQPATFEFETSRATPNIEMSQPATFTLKALGVTRSRSSRYQQEASVPRAVFEAWAQRVLDSDDGMLTAGGLRALARREPDFPLPLAKAASRLRKLLLKLQKEMGETKAALPALLQSLASECETEPCHG
jgi:hypothetical protein